jgi:hypothetical protein
LTDREVREVLADAAKNGVVLSSYEAQVFLGAREQLNADPKNVIARHVVEDYRKLILYGTPVTSFEEFLLPIPRTDETIAEMRRRGCTYL